jgi:hypothetical protein
VSFAPSSIASRDFRALGKAVNNLDKNVPMSGGLQFFIERLATQQATAG